MQKEHFNESGLLRYLKTSKLVSVYLLAIIASCISISLQNAAAQSVVWQDNFDLPAVNSDNWTYDFGDGSGRAAGFGWGNSELEYYTSRPENVRIENGNLLIEARREDFGPASKFTSGRVKTEGRIHFKYGTVEARIKLPNVTKGLWPAFWTLGTIGGTWPSIGEADILEFGSGTALAAGVGNKRVSAAAHWSNMDGGHEYTTAFKDADVDLSLDYHLYKMVWTSSFIKMYIDNVEFYSFDISDTNAPWYSEFHTPHFFLLNIAVGGTYTGIFEANAITAPLPGKMYVDYIKLTQNPGDELYVGKDDPLAGNFGILTENTPVTDSLQYGVTANLYYWNNLVNINNPVPFEGQNVLAVRANANDWFGMGVINNYVNLHNFSTGALKFHYKSSYQGQFKIGLTTGHGETWMNFPAGIQQYGLIRDGNWHEVSIPLADFSNSGAGMNIDIWSVKGAFMFAGDPAISNADFYFDNIYFSGGVSQNPLPTVAITNPVENEIFVTPASITINAEAADENGSVSQVDFYSGNTLLGSDNAIPYSFVWNNPPEKVDTLYAKATDNEGAMTTSSPVVVFVSAAGNTAPSAAITSPVNNATFLTPANITINADVSDATGSIYKVEFYNGTTLLATSVASPYTFTWTGVTAGSYELTVKATDAGGLSATTEIVNISVSDPIKPSVSITSPLNNSSFTPPATITINAEAADANGTVTKVEFFNGAVLLATDNTSPYSFVWNAVPQGEYTLTAKATDNDNNTTVSAPVAVSVAPAACTGVAVSGDYSYEVYTEAGTVFFKFRPLAPIAGSTYAIIYLREGGSGTYPGYGMTASGSDFVFSKPIADGVVTSFYFTYQVPSGGERNSSSDPHSYQVGTVCVAGAPNVSITSPVEAASFTAPASITINATATDANGSISKVEFFNGTSLLGTSETSPYTYTWTGVAAGSYSLTAKATDNSGLSASSIPVNIIVNVPNTNGYCGTAFNGDYEYKAETKDGLVTFTFNPLQPITGCLYALIYIREGLTGGYPGYGMTASGKTFIYTKPIADATPISFYFTYQTPPAGERNSSANPHSYVVGSNCTGIIGVAPTIEITSPTNNASFTEPATITINANAVDTDGTISKVEFFNGATLLNTDNTSPYSYDWTNVIAGNYTLTAKATDNLGLFTISTPVNLVVNIDNSEGFCDTLENGDYSYKVETIGSDVLFQFHPLEPIEGCSYVFIYIREGLTGEYPGYAMNRIGSDFTFRKSIAGGTSISIYFTYNVPSGGERNSSATPHSYIVGTICEGLIPVNLLSFNAALTANGSVALNWSTASELNNDYFLIEKSKDARNYNTVARVEASKQPAIRNDYQVIDDFPFEGLNYYRLVQVDKDGMTVYYDVKTIEVVKKKAGIKLYPNPLNGTLLNIILPESSGRSVLFKLMNMNGQLIHSAEYMPNGNQLRITLPSKPASGVYIIKIDEYMPVKLLVE